MNSLESYSWECIFSLMNSSFPGAVETRKHDLLHCDISCTPCFTLLSFSCWLAQLMLMSSTEFPSRGMGERWDVSRGGGLMLYWTLAVRFTEKNLELGGALLRTRNTAGLGTCCMYDYTKYIKHTQCVCVIERRESYSEEKHWRVQ